MKVALFLDVYSLYYSVKLHLRGKVDYAKLRETVKTDRSFRCSEAYVLTRPGIDQKGFLSALEISGYNVHDSEGDWGNNTRGDPTHYGEMLKDISEIGWEADIICLGSTSGIFAPILRGFKYFGKRIEIVGVKKALHEELLSVADSILELENCLLQHATFPVVRKPAPKKKIVRRPDPRPVAFLGDTSANGVDKSALPRD